ncbi:polyprenyl diphosphate synthase [Mycobacterium basiliense]|uniref:polyprenyl diphosphate synthase n=1 Tax=Mycobacterium basiliense TaxID=2094119 RepID=UPI001E4AB8E1|nr:polyprenyl diphosphate synthase [Mycobacterium basiliense]
MAFVLDGNRRWAAKRGLSSEEGHLAGGKVAFQRVRDACEFGIEQLTLFVFSTENSARSVTEIANLMNIFAAALDRGIVEWAPLGIRLRLMGSRQGLPQAVLDAVDRAEAAMADNDGMDLFIALNYGGRQEVLNAAQHYSGGGEAEFERLLYAPEMRDLDLIIRTGGDRRLSNSFLWHSAYAELLFVDEPWPEFTRERFELALADFAQRVRTYGSSHRQPDTLETRSGMTDMA